MQGTGPCALGAVHLDRHVGMACGLARTCAGVRSPHLSDEDDVAMADPEQRLGKWRLLREGALMRELLPSFSVRALPVLGVRTRDEVGGGGVRCVRTWHQHRAFDMGRRMQAVHLRSGGDGERLRLPSLEELRQLEATFGAVCLVHRHTRLCERTRRPGRALW